MDGAWSAGTRRAAGSPAQRCRVHSQSEAYASFVVFYGVVSAQTEKVFDFFLEREAAEAMIGEARADEPLLAQGLRVEAVELAY